jgi:hypothetical protein
MGKLSTFFFERVKQWEKPTAIFINYCICTKQIQKSTERKIKENKTKLKITLVIVTRP